MQFSTLTTVLAVLAAAVPAIAAPAAEILEQRCTVGGKPCTSNGDCCSGHCQITIAATFCSN
ncbi:hypothetical protein COL26b_004574 [Colletotrichum chrysophilum]|uniref:Uncharacterized protein n=1 Tax=Colletotrichum chrysophilum TaxID=1836956 RepID=A0AAD9AVT6_9PEZI|nr:uncharacterized protein CGMCC3_g162 [Colletotrichum fructicola]XP_053038562.1 uncharacterized protein COL26b_004574 [Colletotrichum chrysophilum]KAE9583655.1 hypothetical protein CGMCC3_g162 [Colletotrichum fructicola]KAJ0377135.1 hypothetical protein COL26b_004574 [Colletotrichum chrysophilum]KAK1855503.1 hypothetical protein CCHR01_01827 [Colletotrichum chrysophilum]